MTEFRQGMAMLGDELDENTVGGRQAHGRFGGWARVSACLNGWPEAGALFLPQVALIGDAMEIHGFVSEAQFKDIVEVSKRTTDEENTTRGKLGVCAPHRPGLGGHSGSSWRCEKKPCQGEPLLPTTPVSTACACCPPACAGGADQQP